MSLLEEWETQPASQGLSDLHLSPSSDTDLASRDFLQARETVKPVFSLDAVKRSISRGRGHVTKLAAANNYISAVTSRGWLLRYDLSEGEAPVTELEISKLPDTCAEGIWVDPSGVHHLLLVQQHWNFESLYFHAKWKKARPVAKLKGVRVTSVGWNPESCTGSSTGDVAVGTAQGSVIAVSFGEKEKKERGGKAVLDMSPSVEPIKGIVQLPLPQNQVLLLISTAKHLYAFRGSNSLEKLGDSYQGLPNSGNSVELPSEFESGHLACYTPPGAIRPSRFQWLAGPGLYRGALNLAPNTHSTSELDLLADRSLLPLPLTSSMQENALAVAQTEYHELVLYSSCLHIINRISQALVQEVPFNSRSTGISPCGPPLGFAEDVAAGIIFVFTADSLVEVVAEDEERNLWQIYLDRKDFANAFRRCRNQAQRDAVNDMEAEMAFIEGRFLAAATFWGKVMAPNPSFEELALKFVGSGSPDALQTYLLTKLDTLAPADKAQATMVATWLTELSLDRLNRALLEQGEGGEADSRVEQLTEELRAFLKQQVGLLDPRTTITLLASYGRMDDLMHYASYRQDNEAVLEYLLQREDAEHAIALLRRPDVSQELFYKFAPGLMALAPHETVDAWMTASPALEPSRLLPALLRYGAKGAPKACRVHTLRYIDHCLHHLVSEDPAIHHLAVALYCSEGEEDKLAEYLETARDPVGKPLYDPQAALQLSRQHHMDRVSIELLWQLHLSEEAMAMALQSGVQQAINLAHRPQEDEGLQRKLWLAIAHHLIRTASTSANQHPTAKIKEINELMREAGGLLKIEDILPLFPDFVQIDNFKEAICQSLEDYNSQIAGLKSEMDDVTRISDALRKDIAKLEQRAGTLSEAEPCASCGRPVGEAPAEGEASKLLPPYFLFPSGNAFHGSCLAREVLELAPQSQKQRLQQLLDTGQKVTRSGDAPGKDGALNNEETTSRLRAELSLEDPYNGEMVIKNVDKPFIVADERSVVESWKI